MLLIGDFFIVCFLFVFHAQNDAQVVMMILAIQKGHITNLCAIHPEAYATRCII